MTQYVVLTYAIGLALLWGYAIALWVQCRSQSRRWQSNQGGPS